MKIGRNAPCPCGSGVKFKKCCLEDKPDKYGQPLVLQDMAKRFFSKDAEPYNTSGFLLGRPFIDAVHNNQRARAVGSQVFIRPLNETFHQFILKMFLHEGIGLAWYKEQIEQKTDHPLAEWFNRTEKVFQPDKELPAMHLRSIEKEGYMSTLLSMSFDFYCLKHCTADITSALVARLKNKNEFWGARYEMAVAGIAVRAGFDIQWLEATTKHCEFLAVHQKTKDRVYFEAKSHMRTENFNPEEARLRVTKHINEALRQRAEGEDIPVVIFDDLNLRMETTEKLEKRKVFERIDYLLKKNKFFEKKDLGYGAVFLTNFSWHLPSNPSGPAKAQNELMLYWHTGGKYSLDPQTVRWLDEASKQYGFVPGKLKEMEGVVSNYQEVSKGRMEVF